SATGGRLVGGGLQLVGQRVVVAGTGDVSVKRLPLHRRSADRHRDARRLVDDCRGRCAGYRGGEAAIVRVARGLNDADLRPLVASLHEIGRAGRAGDVAPVRAVGGGLPPIADGRVGVVDRTIGGWRLALLLRGAERQP